MPLSSPRRLRNLDSTVPAGRSWKLTNLMPQSQPVGTASIISFLFQCGLYVCLWCTVGKVYSLNTWTILDPGESVSLSSLTKPTSQTRTLIQPSTYVLFCHLLPQTKTLYKLTKPQNDASVNPFSNYDSPIDHD